MSVNTDADIVERLLDRGIPIDAALLSETIAEITALREEIARRNFFAVMSGPDAQTQAAIWKRHADQFAKEADQLRAEREAAARCVEFTKWAIQDSAWQGGNLDGGAVQDKAEALGVIVKVPFDPAKHKSDYAEAGDDWFEFAPNLPSSAVIATDRVPHE